MVTQAFHLEMSTLRNVLGREIARVPLLTLTVVGLSNIQV